MRFVKTPSHSSSSVTTKGRYRNAKGNRTNHARKSETLCPFVAVDGEGITGSDGVHRYVLFGVGEHYIEEPTGLHWSRVFDFLYNHYKPGTAYVGFFLGYDFAQIFKTLPENRAHMLLTSEGKALRKHKIAGKAPHPVDFDGWQFDILGMKRLRIRPKMCECENATCPCKPKKPWMYICDAGGFFQTSFLNVIDPKQWPEGQAIVTPEEFDTIVAGKMRRSTAVLDDEMREYMRLENVVLARVMHTLNVGFHQIGIHLPPSKWFGPGQAAQAWMKLQGVAERITIVEHVPAWFLDAARQSYFGGWFEIFMHGIIPGKSHEYDLNSAYPWVISQLPCLLHGQYTHGMGLPPRGSGKDLTLVYARVWSPGMPHSETVIGSMLHRDNQGRILRPSATEGWYWWDELKAAEKCGIVKRLDNRGHQQVMQWVRYDPCDCPPPMEAMKDLYLKRLEVGKTSPLGKAAKLTYNSGYGKTAQSIGEPVFANPIYASRITSECRRRILDAIASHPVGIEHVAMVATDAVYFLTPHPDLPISENLGEWDYNLRSQLTLFKPGVYWDDKARQQIVDGNAAKFKARGINAADFSTRIKDIDRAFRAWNDDVNEPSGNPQFPRVTFRSNFALTSCLQALRRHDWSQAGRVISGVELIQDSDPSDKRTGLQMVQLDGRNVWRSRPHFGMQDGPDGLEWILSNPYQRRFGMEDPWSDEYREVHGITPDGTLLDILAQMLKVE